MVKKTPLQMRTRGKQFIKDIFDLMRIKYKGGYVSVRSKGMLKHIFSTLIRTSIFIFDLKSSKKIKRFKWGIFLKTIDIFVFKK